MSDDYARATGASGFISIDGKEYRVSRFTPRDIGDLQAWLKNEIPDPRIEGRRMIEGLPDGIAREIWLTYANEAKNWPPTLGDDHGNTLLTTTTEGVARLLWVTLRRYNGIDLVKARELAAMVEISQINDIVRLASPESDNAPKV
jgi:hypothetical protein